MTDATKLIERLRLGSRYIEADAQEAAALIEQQAAELKSAQAVCDSYAEENQRLSDRIAAFESAAKGEPFGWVKPAGGNYFTRSELTARRIGGMVPVYLAAPAATDNGGGRDAWISVDERLPDEAGTVLGFYRPFRGDWMIGEVFYNKEEGFCLLKFGWNADDIKVTHWMPKPAPPAALSQKAGEKE
ncbi:DUF551 domain-containing protein [Paraburkholderia phenoliruptrix]|uniref:DUF551 domain-containing protein n=1 Tax=Paraburkholderia phenoliruptrix TaxID=252970 RepID=UPI001C4E34E0|nr:DUF551 domain-containing protein [Paraburkholderia phenoliruptrix]MBW0450886.1 DUF551 domain-containing protein [Paraburkholderia phenoliruptrix]MBW9100979.1 DUF551 domain-containing protein [Paraburkholderia phenoliruptrix]